MSALPLPGRPQFPFHVGHKDVWRIALPACLAFITEPVAGLIHTTVIGRLGDAGMIAGISMGAVAFNILFTLAFFLRFGTAGLTAQAVGAQDPRDGLVHLARAMLIALLLSALVLALSTPLLALLVEWLRPPGTSLAPFQDYVRMRIWSIPLVLINFVLLGWFYGRGKATTGMALQLAINGVNTVFSLLLVSLWGWGVEGLALAKIFGEAAAAAIGIALVLRHYGGLRRLFTATSLPEITDGAGMRRMLGLSRDLMIRSLALNAAMTLFMTGAGRSGETVLAAIGVLMQMVSVTTFLLDGVATAVEQLCGRAIGGNWLPAFRRALKLSMLWGAVIGLGLFVFMLGFGGVIIDAISTSAEVRASARDYLIMAALFPLIGMAAFIYDGAMIGATLNQVMRNGMLMSLGIFLIAFLLLPPMIGIWGLWIAMHLMLLARAAIYSTLLERLMPVLFDPPAPDKKREQS